LTVQKVWAIYSGTDPKHIARRVKHIWQRHHGDDDLE
jgi:hypothetical protein